jgi:Ca-activated chloride channel family protein
MSFHRRFALAFVILAACAALPGPLSPPAGADVMLPRHRPLPGCPPAWLDAATGECRQPRLERLEGEDSPLLLKQTDVRATVTGPVAHVQVTQSWSNPNRGPIDALYVFPLPEKAAVTDMRLRAGDRLIRSEIRRREEARRVFEQARREGRLAGLLDQERPNVFAQEIANLMPGEAIEVILEFDQEVACEQDVCEYVFPTVVGPRFVPARQTDPGRISPPVIDEGLSTGQILTLEADIDAGVPLRDLSSPSHWVRTTAARDGRWRAVLGSEERAALDRDFLLSWRLGGAVPEIGVLSWRDPSGGSEAGVVTVVVQPPAAPRDEEAAPREMVFVLDCSGSMSGAPLAAAKEVVRQALRAIRPGDTFQIIRFSDHASGLGALPLAPTPENIRSALRHLEGLRSEGGTEMISGIRAALGFPSDPRRLRIVAFLTDGYIGNEREILSEVRRTLGGARLFSFGIGSSVNRYLLESLAEEGRGAAAFLEPREHPDDLVERFVARIATPVLTDIRVAWEGIEVEEVEPERPADLFAGQPLLLHALYARPGRGHVVVEGRRAGRLERFRHAVTLPDRAAGNEALARLWARARIHRLDRGQHDGERPEIREAIARLGLLHRLVTAYTSLVAIDSRVSNTTGEATRVEVPVEMPSGVEYDGIFGPREAKVMGSVTSPAPPGFADRFRGLGYLGGAAGAPGSGSIDSGVARQEAARPPVSIPGLRPPQRLPSQPFTLLTLVRANGTRLIVEEDGDLWVQAPRRRWRARRLIAAELDGLRAALAAARPSGWSGRESGERLVVDAPGAQWVVNLPSGDPTVASLVAMLERWGS